jgi:AcrR family transcriptional regulator
MPKLVDHEQRRRDIARATWRVITREGVRAASVRTVAAEAELSMGALRHYFDDQASLVLFAAQHAMERIGERLASRLAAPAGSPLEAIQACLEELLPLDEERHAETAVYFGLIDLTRLAPEHQAYREEMFGWARVFYRALVGWLAGGAAPTMAMLTPAGGAPPPADPILEARSLSLQVFVDGLAVEGLMCPGVMDGVALRSALRAELERLAGELADRISTAC